MSEIEVPHHATDEHKRIGIFIAVLAVIMAMISALAKTEANQIIVKEVQAANGFAWYHAKRERAALNELELRRAEFELAGNPTEAQRKVLEQARAELSAKNAEYEKKDEKILADAKADKEATEVAEHKHQRLEYAEICVHIAVVLSSITLLTDIKLFFHLGIVATIVGVVLAATAYFVH